MNQKLGVILVFFAAMAWSTAGLFTRVVTTDIPTTLFWRSLIGGFCVLAMHLCMQRRDLRSECRRAFYLSRGEIVIGALSTAGMICFISSFFHTTIANVSFVYGTMPLITFLLAWLVLREKGDWISFAACILCVVGVAVILRGVPAMGDLFGIALAFAMTFFMASLTVAAKFFPTVNVVKATYFSGFLGALVVLPFSTFQGVLPADYFWLSLYGIVNLGLGFGVYLLGVQRVTATTAALIGLSEIPIAPLWAYLLFAETAAANTIIGGAIILSATTAYLVLQHINQRADHPIRAG